MKNSSNNFFTTEQSIEKGLKTRSKWSDEKRQAVREKQIKAYKNRPVDKEKKRRSRISRALKSSPIFKEARSKTQTRVWSNLTQQEKDVINEKKSESAKQYWVDLSDNEKVKRAKIRQNWHKNQTYEQKEQWKNNIKKAKHEKMEIYEFYNIISKEIFKGNVMEFSKKYNINKSVAYRLASKTYSKKNIYKKEWVVL